MKINKQYLKFLKQEKKNYLILFTVITFAIFPAFVITHLLTSDFSVIINRPNYSEYTNVFALVTVGILLSVITPLIMFNYKNNKRSIDLIHSLPITRKNLVFINMIVGMLLVIIPVSISYWSGYGLLYIFENLKFSFFHFSNYLKLVLMLIVIMIPSLFVSMNTGTLFDALIYTGIAFVLPFMAYFSFSSFASANIFGLPSSGLLNLNYISPLVALYKQITFDTNSDIFNLFYWLLLGFMFFVISVYLYIKWPSEASEKPISNRYFFPIVVSAVTFISLLFLISITSFPSNARYPFLSVQNLLIPVLISFAIYTSLSILQSRSVKNFKKISMHYIGLVIISLALLFIFTATRGFYSADKIPKLDKIHKITIESATAKSNIFQLNEPYEFQDKKTMNELISFQKNILDYYKKDKNFFNLDKKSKLRDEYLNNLDHDKTIIENDSIKITYHLSRNRKMVREYQIFDAYYVELADLVNHDVVKNVNQPITNPNTQVKDIKVFDATMTEELLINHNDQLQSKIVQDLKNIDLLEKDYKVKYILQYETSKMQRYGYFNMVIDERFTETIAHLENNIAMKNDTDFQFSLLPIEKNRELYTYPQKLIQHNVYIDYDSIKITTDEIKQKSFKLINNPSLNKIKGALLIETEYDFVILPYE
ncbi:MAG TPA: hypothetical protein VIG45_00310 [Erysipelothrix sp.]